MLWTIEGDALPGTSYLFGTMHVRDSRVFEDIGTVFEKIRECEAFAAEFNLGETSGSIDSPLAQLADIQSLTYFIRPEKYQKLRKILLKTTGYDLDHFKYSPPFIIVNLLTEKILRPDMPVSLDEHLWNFAKKEGKSLQGIETLREQLQVLNNISMNDQIKMLLEMGSNINRYRQHLLHMAELYQKGELRLLYRAVKKNSKGLRKLLLYRRNVIMADRILALVSTQTVFSAIGAAHLWGGKGVIRLLKMQGLRVTPQRMGE